MAEKFKFISYRCYSEKNADGSKKTSALVKITIGGKEYLKPAEGVGPVNALAKALVAALSEKYPKITEVELTHFSAKTISDNGTASNVRVNVTLIGEDFLSENSAESDNVVEAGYNAIAACISEFLNAEYP